MKQITLDGSSFRPRKRFKQHYRKCARKWCIKSALLGSDLCEAHGIDHILNYHFGLDEWIIPQITGWSALEYYKIRRKQASQQFF